MDSFFAPLRSTKSNLLPPGNCPSRPLGYPSDVRRRGSLCAVLLIRLPRTVRRLALTIDPVLAVLEVEKVAGLRASPLRRPVNALLHRFELARQRTE
jgi:hypothetical protein